MANTSYTYSKEATATQRSKTKEQQEADKRKADEVIRNMKAQEPCLLTYKGVIEDA